LVTKQNLPKVISGIVADSLLQKYLIEFYQNNDVLASNLEKDEALRQQQIARKVQALDTIVAT